MHRIIVLFILSLFSCFVISQNVPLLPECTTFDKSAAPASGEICSPYLSPQIWLPISGATTLIDTYLNETLLWQVKAAESVMPASCYDSLLSLLCNGAFPPCMVINDLAVANFSCRSTCEHVNNYLCINFFGFFLGEEDKINCSMTDYITGEDQFPVEYHLNTNLFKTNYVNTTCVPPDRLPTTAARELLPCPYPLGRVPSPINPIEPPCNAPCPDFVWTLSQYKALGTIEFTFAFISFILMIFLSLHYLLDPKCRQTTKRFQLYAFLSQAGFAFAFVVAGPDPLATTWCRSGTDFATWDNNARCGTQAFFFVVFGLSAAIYWAISSYLMFITLENPKFVLKRRFELLSHIAGIGIPLSLLGVAIHKKIVTFYWITPMCFIQTQITKGDNGLNYQYALFYIPMCVPILIAIIFVALTMVRIIKHMRSMKQTFKDQSTTGISIVQVNIRLFIWCASLFLFFTTIVVYRAGVESIWRSLRTDAEDWGICKVLVELGLGSGEKCPEDTYPRPLNYAGTVIHYIVTTTLGTFSFFAFGTSTIIYHFWYFLFKSIYERKWDQVVSLVTNQKTYTAMRNSHLRASRAMVKQDNSTNRSSVMLSSASAQNLNKGTSTTASASASASISAVELTDRSESIHSSSD